MLSKVIHRTHVIRAAAAAHDMLASGGAFVLALFLRLGPISVGDYIWQTLWFIALAGVIGGVLGLNSGVWRYASLADMAVILQTATVTVLVFALSLFLFNRLDSLPRTSLIMSWLLMLLMLAGPRIAYRLLRNRRATHASDRLAPRGVLLVGASENAESFIKSVGDRSDLPYEVLGIIDERDRRTGLSIRGVRVLGDLDDIDNVVSRLKNGGQDVEALILTKARLRFGNRAFDQLSDAARRHNISLLRLPEITDLEGEAGADAMKPQPIVLEDLLPRRAVKLDSSDVSRLIKGSTVLVTGAGGSIGSEICRRLHAFQPKRMVLIDNSEYLLYAVDSELRQKSGLTDIVARLGDVRNRSQMHTLLGEQRPDLVFHAAALKHVPMVEAQPLEGLRTNVLGTRNVADAAQAAGSRAFIMISTDKAINPTNVMGATKRMAEAYCQTLDVAGRTHFVTVRFGNVLGSAGSVVPLFERQIKAGGPVTVTHPEIERYFMTIPEAAQLVLHATSANVSGESPRGRLFVLDMGEPVKIVDVARKMIRLAGFQPDKDIAIEFIGLRPGEKLHEELFAASEGLVATNIAGVLAANTRRILDQGAIAGLLDDLAIHIEADDLGGALRILKSVVPEYVPDKHLAGYLTEPAPVLQVVAGTGSS